MKIQSQPKAFVGLQRFPKQRGFTVVQVLVSLALVGVITAFALMAVGSARASMRLNGSTRELAGYLEKARSNAIRRNAKSFVTILDANSYRVRMDFDGDGDIEDRIITLQDGVTFPGLIGVSAEFDWRGRVQNPILFELAHDGLDNTQINLSGAGDVTIGSEIFEDLEIGTVTLNSNMPTGVADIPAGSPHDGSSPTPTPTPTPTEETSPTPTPTPTPTPPPTSDPTPTPTPTTDHTPTPTPTPALTPTPTPTPTAPCVLSAPATLTVTKNLSPKTISVVTITNANNTLLTATRSGDISKVEPETFTISGNGTIPYKITYASGNKSGSITVTSSCGTKTINITFE